MKGYCCECGKEIECLEVNGDVIYPHRPDLYDKHFWQCPHCKNYTGRYDGEYPTLPSKHIRWCRYTAHRKLDKIWRNRHKKGKYYGYMSDMFKRDFHWGMIKSNEEADKALEYTIKFLEGE